ncbi:MAG: DEAD/DEAH box helicase [Candidatus Eisenbacteria bacterium]|nr:DEAD/DEAH box helicase [Candidatus Eisenbacteria bacterium]
MTTSPPSSSEGERPSSAFGRLHPLIQRWVWDQGWTDLREIQERAVAPILRGDCDVLIAAATAGGKTEAAFLPLLSRVLTTADRAGVRVLCVSPLKALINDQFGRLELLCERLQVPVHRWHGDVASTAKRRLLADPTGILFITPESLEALFVLRGTALPALFAGLERVIVDELHAFIGSERGQQLQSLLSRLELVLRRRVPRVGLSATLGDMHLAAAFLRPGRELPCETLVSSERDHEVRLQIRGYRVDPSDPSGQPEGFPIDLVEAAGVDRVAEHLFGKLRGSDNLIFANSRRRVEVLADRLRRLSEAAHVPNEFWPHHGSLARELRDHAETALKDPAIPASVVCTTTLEMGIDIGTVEMIAQVGVPPSVAALRQRLGRSGRRGQPSVMRIYVEEPKLSPDSPPQDQLRTELVQAVAMVRLLVAGWCEPPSIGALHLSTLVQQVLSLIAQYGGCGAADAWRILCRDGAFRRVDQATFAALLRDLGQHDLIVQATDHTLLLGGRGEQLVNHYSFYSAFVTEEEYRLESGGKALGSIPISHPLTEESYVIFAGRRWHVVHIDIERKVIELAPAPAGRAPQFTGSGVEVHGRIREEMKAIYSSSDTPTFLDPSAAELLREGRAAFLRYKLDRTSFVEYESNVAFFPWADDIVVNTIVVMLRKLQLPVARDGIAVIVSGIGRDELVRKLARTTTIADPQLLARAVVNKRSEKYHPFLGDELLALDHASSKLDVPAARRVIDHLTHYAP